MMVINVQVTGVVSWPHVENSYYCLQFKMKFYERHFLKFIGEIQQQKSMEKTDLTLKFKETQKWYET